MKHTLSSSWYESYKKSLGDKYKKKISDDDINLARYFISSNDCLEQLKNKSLRAIIKKELHLYSYYAFRNRILNEMKNIIKKSIENKMNLAQFITLITDGWTSLGNSEYIGIK